VKEAANAIKNGINLVKTNEEIISVNEYNNH
jgi:hypothetical protein